MQIAYVKSDQTRLVTLKQCSLKWIVYHHEIWVPSWLGNTQMSFILWDFCILGKNKDKNSTSLIPELGRQEQAELRVRGQSDLQSEFQNNHGYYKLVAFQIQHGQSARLFLSLPLPWHSKVFWNHIYRLCLQPWPLKPEKEICSFVFRRQGLSSCLCIF